MQKILYFVILVFVALIAYKIGDSRGFQAGYEVGYIYDCQVEVTALKQQHDDLKKAVDFANKKSSEVQQENARLEYSRQHYQDSLKNVERVKHLNDSISKLKDKSDIHVDPYTGQVRRGVLRVLREAQGGNK